MTPDPIGIAGGLNLYSYAGQNPVMRTDFYGLEDNTSPWQLGWEWLTGSPTREHYFTNGDPAAEMLRVHRHIQDIIRGVSSCRYKMHDEKYYRLGGIQGIPKYAADYSSLFTLGLTGNLMGTYLGGYNVQWTITDFDPSNRVGTLHMTIVNESTVASGFRPPFHGYMDWWNDYIGNPLNRLAEVINGPMRRTTQQFDLYESVTIDCECQEGR